MAKGDHEMESALRGKLLEILKNRFAENMHRHPDVDWSSVQARLESNDEKLHALSEMERTGGEPDVVGRDEVTGALVYCDCSPESPTGRRSLCYDHEAHASRTKNKPRGSAIETASSIGIELLSEHQYRELQ